MRADRLLSILLLMQTQRHITARELAQRLEVSERTIHRDLEALSSAGVPVYAERGPRGGWFLPEPYRTNLTGLSTPEIQTLFLARPPQILADLGLQAAFETARIKLLATLPAGARRNAESVRERLHVDTAGWNRAGEAVPHLPTLLEAVWQERKLSLTYQRSDGTTVERVVDPLGLVAKGSVWYLVAMVDGEYRTYRVSRIQAAQVGAELCIRPEGFHLATYWEQSSADFVAQLPRYTAMVRVAPGKLPWIRAVWRFARIEREDPPDARGWSPLVIRFDVEDEAIQYILGLGPEIEVLEPHALREKLIQLAQGVLTLYRA